MTDPTTGPEDLTFGPFRLDLRNRRLTRGGAVIALGGKALSLLSVLAEAGGAVVSKIDIFERVWAGVAVEENNLQVQISALRKALGDGWIGTVPGRGYHLSPVRSPAPEAARLVRRPTLAVLPLVNLSDDPDQEYFADALTEEITAALSRIRWFQVVARSSAFAYKGRVGVDIREVGRTLGARFIVEGSVRRAGTRVRMTGSLIDAQNGFSIWSDRYEAGIEDVLALQDRLSGAVAGAIEPVLRRAEISRARNTRTDHPDAYDLYLRALPLIWAGTRDGYTQAVVFLKRAIATDPGFGLAKASLAFTLMNQAGLGWGHMDDGADGARLAGEALASHPDDPEVLQSAGHAIAYFARDYDGGATALDRALALNPNSIRTLMSAGWVRCYRVEPLQAIELFEQAQRLNPVDPEIGYRLSGLGLAYLITKADARAVPVLRQAMREMPRWTPSLQFLVVALHRLGHTEEAREKALRLTNLMPRLRARSNKFAFRPGEFCDEFVRVLEEAGIPK